MNTSQTLNSQPQVVDLKRYTEGSYSHPSCPVMAIGFFDGRAERTNLFNASKWHKPNLLMSVSFCSSLLGNSLRPICINSFATQTKFRQNKSSPQSSLLMHSENVARDYGCCENLQKNCTASTNTWCIPLLLESQFVVRKGKSIIITFPVE